MQVVKRSENKAQFRYTVETLMPNGDWVKDMASNDLGSMVLHAHYLQDTYGKSYRVVDELA